jgi:hypothetical protein
MHFIGMLAFIMPMPRKAAIIKEANSSAKEAGSPGEHERLSLSALLAWQ